MMVTSTIRATVACPRTTEPFGYAMAFSQTMSFDYAVPVGYAMPAEGLAAHSASAQKLAALAGQWPTVATAGAISRVRAVDGQLTPMTSPRHANAAKQAAPPREAPR